MSNEKKIILLTCYCHFLTHLAMLIFPALVTPLAQEFQMPVAEVVKLGLWMYLLYGLGGLPMGMLSDVWGSRRMLALFLIGTGGFSLMAGLSESPRQLLIGLTAMGTFASIFHPAGIGLISRACLRRGKALGIMGVFGSLGLGAGPLLAGIITYTWGWQAVYLALGAPMVLTGIWTLFVEIDERSVHPDVTNREEERRRQRIYFAVLLVCMMLGGFCYRATSVLLPAYFEQAAPFLHESISQWSFLGSAGIPTLVATLVTSLVYFMGIFGQIIGGHYADRVDLRFGYLISHLASLPFMILMALLADIPLVLAALGYIFFTLGMQPIENSLVARLTPASSRGTGYGLKFVFTFGIGGVAVQTSSYLVENHSYEHVFWLQSGVIVLLLVFIGWLIFLTRREKVRN